MTTTTKKPTDQPAAAGEPVSYPSLIAALAAFHRALPRVGKDNVASVRSEKGSYQYRYADLSEISPVVLPLLGAVGLAWSTRPTIEDGLFVLHYELAHESGEVKAGTWPLPDARSSPQVLGSALTYARRYTLCAVTGIAPGGDDDDAQATAQRQTPPTTNRPAANQTRQRPQTPARPEPAQDEAAEDPATAADRARARLRATCEENGWDQRRVAARFTGDLRAASAAEIEKFRGGLFAVSSHELTATPDDAPTGEAPTDEEAPK